MGANGKLSLVNLGPGKIPVAGVYLGTITNFQDIILTGEIQVTGDLTDVVLSVEANASPIGFTLGALGLDGKCPYAASLVRGADPGSYQWQIMVGKPVDLIGKFIVSATVMDMMEPDTDDLAPIQPLGGVLALLQVAKDDFVVTA